MRSFASRPTVLSVLCVAGIFCSTAEGQSDRDPWELRFQRVTTDVHVAYRPEPLRFIVEGNVTIIVNPADVVVVDGSGAPRAARQVIAYVRRLTRNPVRILVNTHGHGDHTLGNQEYVRAFPGVEIVSRPETRAYLTGSGIDYVRQIAASTASRKQSGAEEIARLEREGGPGSEAVIAVLRQYYEGDLDLRQQAYRTVTVTPPTMTFTDRLVLHRGVRDIDIRYLGPGDTHGDVVVHLPQDRIVITGDMVVHPIPYGFSRHSPAWTNTLDSLAGLDFDILIPGHGEVQRGKAYLDRVRALLRDVQSQIGRGLDRGLDLEGIRREMDLDRWREAFAGDDPVLRYFFREYFSDPNVERTYNAMVAERSGG